MAPVPFRSPDQRASRPCPRAFCVASGGQSACSRSERAFWRGSRIRRCRGSADLRLALPVARGIGCGPIEAPAWIGPVGLTETRAASFRPVVPPDPERQQRGENEGEPQRQGAIDGDEPPERQYRDPLGELGNDRSPRVEPAPCDGPTALEQHAGHSRGLISNQRTATPHQAERARNAGTTSTAARSAASAPRRARRAAVMRAPGEASTLTR
jgi:hypothetical protein